MTSRTMTATPCARRYRHLLLVAVLLCAPFVSLGQTPGDESNPGDGTSTDPDTSNTAYYACCANARVNETMAASRTPYCVTLTSETYYECYQAYGGSLTAGTCSRLREENPGYCPEPKAEGACCVPYDATTGSPSSSESCFVGSQDSCDNYAGTWSEGAQCSEVECTYIVPGACCGVTSNGQADECRDVEDSTTCPSPSNFHAYASCADVAGSSSCPAPRGACCNVDANGNPVDSTSTTASYSNCTNHVTEDQCYGSWVKHGTCDASFSEDECPALSRGACCLEYSGSTTCQMVTEASCLAHNGTFSSTATCSSDLCHAAACCDDDGGCRTATRAECFEGGGKFHSYAQCTTTGLCPVGSCCALNEDGSDYACSDNALAVQCNGAFRPGGECADLGPLACKGGACCYGDECRSPTTRAQCANSNGFWHPDEECPTAKGDTTTLRDAEQKVTAACPALGACCLANSTNDGVAGAGDATCMNQVTRHRCVSELGGEFLPRDECVSNTECPRKWACCSSTPGTVPCVEATAAQCAAAGDRTHYPGSHCSDDGKCPLGRCCIEDNPLPECDDDFQICHNDPDWRVYRVPELNCTFAPCDQYGVDDNGDGTVDDETRPCSNDPSLAVSRVQPYGAFERCPLKCLATTAPQCRELNGEWSDSQTCPCERIGACCLESECKHVTRAKCHEYGGKFNAGTRCRSDPFGQLECPFGACCHRARNASDGDDLYTCTHLHHKYCALRKHSHFTPGVPCSQVSCYGGACCEQDAAGNSRCTVRRAEECNSNGGTLFLNEHCPASDTCPERHACCLNNDGTTTGTSASSSPPGCIQATETQCARYSGVSIVGETCVSHTECPKRRACCLDDSCEHLYPAQCRALNGTRFPYDDCEADNACPRRTACCIRPEEPPCSDRPCVCAQATTSVTPSRVSGETEAGVATCRCPDSCEKPTGCQEDLHACPDGSYVARDPDNWCAFHPCPTKCADLTPAECEHADGSHHDNAICDDKPCEPRGACCTGSECLVTTADECERKGGKYNGHNTNCENPDAICPSACCIAATTDTGSSTATSAYCTEVTGPRCAELQGRFVSGSQCLSGQCPMGGCCTGTECLDDVHYRECDGKFRPATECPSVEEQQCNSWCSFSACCTEDAADIGRTTTTSRACTQTTATECHRRGGNYSYGLTCEDPSTGGDICPDNSEVPCCLGDTDSTKTCAMVAPGVCRCRGGSVIAGAATCDDVASGECGLETGACCKPDGQCAMATPSDCEASGGEYSQGEQCTSNNECPPTFPCCIGGDDVVCSTDTKDCGDGIFVSRDPERGCLFRECANTNTEPATCAEEVTTRTCPDGTTLERDPNSCSFPSCPPTCVELTERKCKLRGGEIQTSGGDCNTTDICAVKGSCCFDHYIDADFSITCRESVSRRACVAEDGVWHPHTSCEEAECPEVPKGSCCTGDACISGVDEHYCNRQQGEFFQGQDCRSETECPLKGACCRQDTIAGTTVAPCSVTTKHECEKHFGRHLPGEDCNDDGTCPEPSGCCLEDGCANLLPKKCARNNGTRQRELCRDDRDICEKRACCGYEQGGSAVSFGTCVKSMATFAECRAHGGPEYDTWLQLPETCTEGDQCNAGACCYENDDGEAKCDDTVSAHHCYRNMSGHAWSLGESCDSDTCPQRGACCQDTECKRLTREQCKHAGGDDWHESTDCHRARDGSSICPFGACCRDGACEDTHARDCADGTFTAGGACEHTECARTYPCCHTNGTKCEEVTPLVCRSRLNGRVFYHSDTCGDDGSCPPTGSCCLEASTADTLAGCKDDVSEGFCRAVSGAWTAGGECHSQTACDEPTWACCGASIGGTADECHELTVDNCKEAGGRPLVGLDCGNDTHPTCEEEEIKTCCIAEAVDPLPDCPDVLHECEDGTLVPLIPELGCEPAPCEPTVGCERDVKICHDGTTLVRDPDNYCLFPKCPGYCRETTERECKYANGRWGAADSCDDEPCAPKAACCIKDTLPVCTDDAMQCEDGTSVSRSPYLNCEFEPCGYDPATALCTDDAKQCPDGSYVSRKAEIFCAFEQCPDACLDTTRSKCWREYQGEWKHGKLCAHEPSPCEPERGSCCRYSDDGSTPMCMDAKTRRECAAVDGTWSEGSSCSDDDVCPARWACCLGTECKQLPVDECRRAGGEPHVNTSQCAGTADRPRCPFGACCAMAYVSARIAEGDTRPVPSGCRSNVHVDDCPMDSTGNHYNFAHGQTCADVGEYFCVPGACCGQYDVTPDDTTTSRCKFPTTARKCYLNQGVFHPWERCPSDTECPPSGACCLNGSPNSVTGTTSADGASTSFAPGCINNANRHYCKSQLGGEFFPNDKCTSHVECPAQSACCGSEHPDCRGCCMATPAQCRVYEGRHLPGQRCLQVASTTDPTTFVATCPRKGRCCWYDQRPVLEADNVTASIDTTVVSAEVDAVAFCTRDVRECPDGSVVSREPPTCQFPLCPPACLHVTEGECKRIGGSAWDGDEDCDDAEACLPRGSCCVSPSDWPTLSPQAWCVPDVTEKVCTVRYGGRFNEGTECSDVKCYEEPPIGSCCLANSAGDSRCKSEVTSTVCREEGGEFFRGQDCPSDTQCPIEGACCYGTADSPRCRHPMKWFACVSTIKGRFLPGERCPADDKCPEPAACCLGSGCTHATQYKCEVNGGVWHANDTCFATVDDTVADSTGVDAFAEASICEPRGPCCLPELCTDSLTVNDTACTRPCRELTRSQCDRLAGEFGEPGTRCTLDTCAARGKCCLPPDSSTGESQCVDDVTERTCKLRGGRFGAGSTCEVPCPAATRGACCDPTTNVACRVVNEADCPDTARFFANEECNRDGTCPLPGSCCVHKLVPVDDDDTNPDDPNDDDDDAGMCADRQSHVFGELEFDADVEWTHRFSRLDGINYYVVRTNWNESVGLTSNTQTSACVGANNDRSVLATGRNGNVGLSAIPIHLSFAEPACKMSVYFQVGGTNAVTLVASDGGNVIGSDKSEGTAVEDELSCGMPGPARRVGSVSLAVSRADYLNGAGITSAIISSGSSVMVIRAVEFCTCTPASATTATTATDSAANAQYVRVTECHDDTTRATCGRLGGVHSPGDECLADDKCPVASACCIGTSGCLMRTPAQCRAVGGKLLENEQCQPTSTGGSIIGTCPTRASCCLNEPTYCTADVRKCPDNETYVSRVPPLCEFAPCDVPDFCPQDDVRVCPHSGVELQRDPRLGCQFPPCPPVCKDLTKYQCERLQGSWNEDAECDSLNGYCQVRGACCGANAENCRDGVGERLCKHNNGTFFGHKRCSDLTDDQCPIDRSGACCSAVDGGYRCGIVDQSNECDGQFYLGGNCDELQKDQCPLPRGSCCIAKDSNDEYTCRNSVTKATCDRFDGRWQLNTACADLTQEECPLDTNEPDVGACCSRLSTSVGGAVCADDVEATDCPVESAFFVNTTCARLPSDVCPVLGGCCLPDFVPGSMRYCLDNVPQTYCERYADGARWFRGVCSNSAGEPALTAAGLPVCPRPARKGACCLAGSSTSTTPCLDETTDAECERAEGEFFFRRRCANLTEDECSEKGSCCVVPEPPNAECFGHNFDADDLDVPRTNEFFVAGDDINVTYSVRVTSLNQILGVVPNSPAGTSSCIPADEDYYLLGSGVGGATSAPDDDIVGFSAFPITVRFSPPIAAFSLAAQVGGYSSVLVVGRDAAGSTLFRLTSDGVPTTEGNCGSQGGPARRHVEVSYAGALRRNLIHSISVSSGQSVLTLRKLRGCRNAEEDDVSTNQAYCVDETTRRNCKQLGGSFNTDAPCSDLSQDVCPTDPPQQPEGACCLGIASSRTGRCRDSTTADTCDELGGRFYLERRCASLTETECSSLGACCVADRNRCFDDFPRRRCDDLNGTHSPRTECDDLTQEQCPTEVVEDPLYACCVRLSDGLAFCADTTADTCEDNQGHWTNGTECSGLSQDVCPTEDPRGSCCLRDPVSGDYRGCYDNLREDSCARHGGSWLEDVKCADRPSCQPPPPVVKGSCCLANSAGSLSAVWCLDDLEEDQCDTLTGSFNSNKTCVELTDTCTPPDTTPRGSCCTPNGQCLDRVIEERCTALEGYWHESIFCSTRPCVRLLIVRVLVVVHNINIDLLTEEQLEALRRAIALDCANAWNMAVTDIIVGAIRRQVDAATGADGAPKLSVRPEESGAVIEINVGQPVSNEEELEQFNEVVDTLLEDDIPFVNVAEAVPPTAKEDPTEPVAYDRTASKSEVATFSDPDYSNFDSPDSSGSGGSPVMFLVAGAIVALAAVGVVSWCRKKRNSRRPSDDVSSSRVQMSVPDDDQPGLQSRSGSGTRPYREGELGEL